MSRRPARFTVLDVQRALKGAEAAGVRSAVEIMPDGRIRVVPIAPDSDEATDRPREHVDLDL